jgi:N-acetylglucosamine malate deacetylase 1
VFRVSARVLIVAAHPDDEVLGCGGTIARHAAAGDQVSILIMATGATARGGDAREIDSLKEAARKAAAVLGARAPEFADFPDNRMDQVALLDVIQRVERTVRSVAPTLVYTHHRGDLNVDHRIAHEAVCTACRPLPGSSVHRLLAFETVSSTEWGHMFTPTCYVETTPYLERKLEALEAYAGEMRAFPHARSLEAIRALATLRGAQAGVFAAEAFEVVRDIVVCEPSRRGI